MAVEDAFHDERFNRHHFRKWRIHTVLVVPILLKNVAIGVIFFNYQTAVHHFQEMPLDFGRQLAASISLAFENTRLIENLQKELNERKKAEYQLEQANAHLEQRVQERTAALEQLMIELQNTADELQNANLELEDAQEELVGQNEELIKALETEKSLRKQLIQAEKYAALYWLLIRTWPISMSRSSLERYSYVGMPRKCNLASPICCYWQTVGDSYCRNEKFYSPEFVLFRFWRVVDRC